ncbi:MAG: hypothetical protein ACD_79C01284G0001 [uncultured bacterium]|nr:MAG: hypothetical protein ACD_79C01284G0001 [uncultured bacterium]
MKQFFIKIFVLIIISLIPLSSYAEYFNLGVKYGYAYFDNDDYGDYDKGKTYGAIAQIPLDRTFDIEVEYGKFEDDDGLVDGDFIGGYLGAFLLNLRIPIKVKAGAAKQDIEFTSLDVNPEDIDEVNFSWGAGTGMRFPLFSGYVEYLQISKEVHTIAITINF